MISAMRCAQDLPQNNVWIGLIVVYQARHTAMLQTLFNVEQKPMDEVYTLSQIKEYWDAYRARKAWRMLKDGKWVLKLTAPALDGAAVTRAEMVKLRDHVSFPKYLETLKNG